MRETIFSAVVVVALSLMIGGITWLVMSDHPSSPMELRFEAVEQRLLILEEEHDES